MRLRNGNLTEAFERLDSAGGGVLEVPAGIHEIGPTAIDLEDYPNLRNNVTIRGEGPGASVFDLGRGDGDGFSLVDSAGSDVFYTEITGVGFQGERSGVLVRIGRDDFHDAYNSCKLHFQTNNGHPDAAAACRLNHVLNSDHFGVHNANGGIALECRQVQFGGITGSVRSNRDVSMVFDGYSFANAIEWLNVEACMDGVAIRGRDCGLNRFGTLYGANVEGTLFSHEANVRTRIDIGFVGSNVERVDRLTAGSYSVGISNQPFEYAT